jgi:hypothetical protein
LIVTSREVDANDLVDDRSCQRGSGGFKGASLDVVTCLDGGRFTLYMLVNS